MLTHYGTARAVVESSQVEGDFHARFPLRAALVALVALIDLAGSSRDQKLFAEQVWLEVTARLDDRRDEPHEHLSPVSWHAGATLGSIPTP